MNKKTKTLTGMIFILMSVTITTVSAYVYEQAQLQVTQTIREIATLTLGNSALGNIEEGQTIYYTPTNQSDLNNIISITTTKAHVYLHLVSTLASQGSYYSTYAIEVRYDAVPGGSSHSTGQTACTLTIASPNSNAIDLDVSGSWTFDFYVTTTAKSVNADTATTGTITVTAESS